MRVLAAFRDPEEALTPTLSREERERGISPPAPGGRRLRVLTAPAPALHINLALH